MLPLKQLFQRTIAPPGTRWQSTAASNARRQPPTSQPYTHLIHVHAHRKNTLVTLTAPNGNAITHSSSGMAGYKGAQRGSLDAALAAGQLLIKKTTEMGIKPPGVWLKLNGFGGGREGVGRALREAEWRVVRVQDTTPIPWAGDRPKKRKRR